MTATDTPMDALQQAVRAEADLRGQRRQIVDELNRLKAKLVFMDDRLRTAHCFTVECEAAVRNSDPLTTLSET